MPPKLSLVHKRGHFSSSKINPAARVIARQLSGKNCLAAIFASRHQDASPGPLGLGARPGGRAATQRSEKGSQKVLGRVLGNSSQKGSEKAA